MKESSVAVASEFVSFLNASPTHFHAVHQAKVMLESAGYQKLSERGEWKDRRRGGKYFFTRNHSAIIAFAIGEKYVPGNAFMIIGAHTDSPCPKLKPVSKTKTDIRCFINMSLYNNFNEGKKAHELWEKIDIMLENKNVVNRVLVFRKIVRLGYQDGSSMTEHMNALQGLINQMTSLKVPLASEVLDLLLLRSLPDRWEMLIVTLGNSGPKGKHLSLARVKSSLLNEEARRKDQEFGTDWKALVTEGDTNRGRCRNRSPENREKSGTRSESRGRPTCFYYGKLGHFQKSCRNFQKDKGGVDGAVPKKILERRGTSTIATSEELLLIIEESELHLVSDESTWVVDSGASYHLTPDRKCFSSYRAGDHGFVKMGNEGACRIVGIGDVCLTTSTGCRLLLRDVRHVPKVRLNVISTGRLDDEGYTGRIRNSTMKFCKGSLIVARARKINTLYLMHARIWREEVNVASDTFDELWHKRLCHMNQKEMKKLVKDNLISEVKNTQLKKCTNCLADKQNSTSFQSRPPMRRKAPLELVHTDVCQVDTKSHAGSQYLVTFIDDHSRKLWVSTLKTKDQVLSIFKEFHAKVERYLGNVCLFFCG